MASKELFVKTGFGRLAYRVVGQEYSALKTAAGISICFSHMSTIYGHYMRDDGRRNSSSTTEGDLLS
jgi:hypothetical protein